MGIISAIGDNCKENLHNLIKLRSGIGDIQYLDTLHKGHLACGEVKHSLSQLEQMAGSGDIKGLSRAALLGIIAAREAVTQAHLQGDPRIRTGIISGTTGEAMTSIEAYFPDFQHNDSKNEYIDSQEWGHSTELIAQVLGIDGYMTTINTACSSAANAISLGARMIKNGLLDRAIVGGTDALSKVLLNGFNTLMIVDQKPTKPFDAHRNGMNLGEGAAFLVLESAQINDGRKALATIGGYGIMNEAFHLTAQDLSGEGAYMAMKYALEMSGLSPSDIDYVNAHGTGTMNNDLSEGRAIERLFGSDLPCISSTKPFTGHALGATGALEAVVSIMAIQHQVVFPNLNFSQQMEELHFSPVTKLMKKPIRHVLSNALGFGGNNTSLIFSAC